MSNVFKLEIKWMIVRIKKKKMSKLLSNMNKVLYAKKKIKIKIWFLDLHIDNYDDDDVNHLNFIDQITIFQ